MSVVWLRSIAIGVSLVLAGSATGQTLSLVPDQASYQVGETVTVDVIGDPGTQVDTGLFATLSYDESLLSGASVATVTPTFFGLVPLDAGVFSCGAGECVAVNYVNLNALPIDQTGANVWATFTFTANAPGTTPLEWSTERGLEVDFFGLTSAPGVSIEIVAPPVVPSVGSVGLGLLFTVVLVLAARLRHR